MASALAICLPSSSSLQCRSYAVRKLGGFPASLRPTVQRGAFLRVRAAQDQAPPPLKTPESFGQGTGGAWFGFGPRQEVNVGRLAMMGFASAVVMEVVTGKGVFGQLGLDPITIRYPFLLGLTFLLVAGLLGGYVVINNPPDFSKAPPNLGDGAPRNPFDKNELDRLPTFTRGGESEPYVSDLPEEKK